MRSLTECRWQQGSDKVSRVKKDANQIEAVGGHTLRVSSVTILELNRVRSSFLGTNPVG